MAHRSEFWPEPVTDARAEHVYTAAVRHFLHQDRILWEWLRIVFILQIATIGGVLTFTGAHPRIEFVMLLVGVAVWTIVMVVLAKKTERDRDVNIEMMDFLARYLVTERLRVPLLGYVEPKKQERLKTKRRFPDIIRWSEFRPRGMPRGATILYGTLWTFVTVDFLLIAWALYLLTP
jgi:uncharacterized membrane protein